jgi:hypothetical protein
MEGRRWNLLKIVPNALSSIQSSGSTIRVLVKLLKFYGCSIER